MYPITKQSLLPTAWHRKRHARLHEQRHFRGRRLEGVDDPQDARSRVRGFPGAHVKVEVKPHHLGAPRARNRRDDDLTVANSFDRVLRSFEERD